MSRWVPALLAFLALCGSLWLYAATGAGDCSGEGCAEFETWDQRLAGGLLPAAAFVWIAAHLIWAVRSRNVWEAIASTLLLLLSLFVAFSMWWILSQN